jgi:hypothetical protein
MKHTTKVAGIVASITLVAFLLPSLTPHQAKAAGPSGGEQYKVINTDSYGGLPQFEAALNKLGEDGWKVRISIGSALVLAK